MGFFSSLFKKKQPAVCRGGEIEQKETTNSIKKSQRGYPSDTGLYPSELIMLFYAPEFSVGEVRYPEYFRTEYAVGFPKKSFEDLCDKGYIRPSLASESLIKLKVVDLKKIASEHGIATSGKKVELAERIKKNVPEEKLKQYISNYYWVLTELGENEVDKNRYLKFLVEKHSYSLRNCDIDIWRLNELHHMNPNGNFRDILWGEFNRISVDTYQVAMTKGEFQPYCMVLETMALFLEEENRFIDALQMYSRYLYYKINFQAALTALNMLSLTGDTKESADTYYVNADGYSWGTASLQQLSNECNFSPHQLKEFLEKRFSEENDEGYFTNKELADFVMFELSGENELAEKLCLKATKRAKKRTKK